MADLDYEFSLGGFFLSAVTSSLIGATTACLFRSKKAKISSMLNEYIDNIHTIQQKVERDINSKIVNVSSSKQLLCDEINILKNNLKYLWNQIQSKEAYASVFCPAKIQKKSHLLVQVYVHSFSETEKVIELSKESQKKAERRDYIPLAHNLRKGDKVDIQLNITGETLLKTEMKSLVWNGSFNKCTFDFFVPADIEVNELSCKTILCVNNLPIGELVFTTTIADISSNMLTEVKSHKYKKIFISYSHKDEDKVRFLSEGFNMLDIPHFFDRKSLKAGDIFPEEIQKYIETADLFVLCWSENAAKSDYVALERRCALQRAYPQIKPQHEAKLSIYPLNIKPKAELPNDMKGKYHFGEFN